ncbi:hypothetical protein [Iningainema tapete]|uniref:Uncharacterized protein n=1 Tax=Iningainema tapete BLCC-T55 TaxID=2748662 RepID=A0A8J6XMX0_9CYAN|nr:hypothetical protein [Iningainema tapete]MBD2770908.1 hypothetical protein [Iningainema tapete BLCC-T55]
MRFSYTSWLFGVALGVLGIGLTNIKVAAQMTYTFDATYNVSSTSIPVTSNVSATTISGQSTDAPYGLTNVSGLTYTQTDLTTGSFRFNTNPATFGLQSLPQGEVTLFGSGSNRLLGTNNATGVINFTNLTGTAANIFTITGGEGLFQGATGILTLREVYQISLDPTIPTTGISQVSGTISVFPTQIPESRTTTALIGVGSIMTTFLLRKNVKFPF